MSDKQPVPNIPPVPEPTDAVSTDVIIDDQPISTDPSQTDLPVDDSTIDDSGDSGDARLVAGDSLEKIEEDRQAAQALGMDTDEDFRKELEARAANLAANEAAAEAARRVVEEARAKKPRNQPPKPTEVIKEDPEAERANAVKELKTLAEQRGEERGNRPAPVRDLSGDEIIEKLEGLGFSVEEGGSHTNLKKSGLIVPVQRGTGTYDVRFMYDLIAPKMGLNNREFRNVFF